MSTNLAHALDVLGDRWTLRIVDGLLEGPQRFSELAEKVDGIAPNVLTARLRQLERAGLVVATPYSQRPVRLAYALSDSGRELADAISLLAAWGARQTGDTEGPVHGSCGTALETRLFCPTCERPVDASVPEAMSWI